jgi:hypothetical protein
MLYHLLSTKEPYNEAVFHGCDEEALKRAISALQTSRSTRFKVIPYRTGDVPSESACTK